MKVCLLLIIVLLYRSNTWINSKVMEIWLDKMYTQNSDELRGYMIIEELYRCHPKLLAKFRR